MRYSAELAARAEAWLARPLEQKRSAEGLTELGSLWATLQGLPAVACRQCQYSERARAVAAYVREYHRFISSPDAMSDSQYTFAPQFAGETIADGRYNKTVTAENITDDDARALLKLGYDHVIVKKGKADAKAEVASSPGDAAQPSEAEQKLQTSLEAEQKAHGDTKLKLTKSGEALKAEKDAHKATAKELTDTKKLLAEANEKLAKAQEATKPQSDAPQSDTAVS